MNDIIYLLDEGLESLSKIREYEGLVKDGALARLDPGARSEKEQQNVSTERVARSCLLLANETFRALTYITKKKAACFVREELVDRFAQMLSHSLVRIAGPKSKDFQVATPLKYKFDSGWLSKKIIEIYLHFSPFDAFVDAVSRDNRSFEKKLYIDIAANVYRLKLITLDTHTQFSYFIQLASAKMEALIQQEADLGDIPDEFVDPILSLLMTDPIKLPSGITVDRQTITRHLLSQPNDPYNRQPLTIEELVPDTELKAKIDAWLESKKQKKS
jgi:ubiquitin conjugation factor E4 B